MFSMDGLLLFLLLVLGPCAVYILARIIFTAYFRSKGEFLRKYFNGSITDQKGDGS